MTASHGIRWIPSSKRNPCPICKRDKDGDCRVSGDGQEAICHHPKDLKPGEVVNGWAFTGNTSDGRAGHFTLDKPREQAQPGLRKVIPLRRGAPQPAPIVGPIQLARIEQISHPTNSSAGEGTEHREWWQQQIRTCAHAALFRWLKPEEWQAQVRTFGYRPQRSYYGGTELWVERIEPPGSARKTFRCFHSGDAGPTPGAGPDPWPVYNDPLAKAAGRLGLFVLEAEGEKCADFAVLGGLVAICQPGHAHKVEQVADRYRNLRADGVAGVVFLADHDAEGQRRAEQAREAAALVGLPLLVLPAAEVWPDLPQGGSIDDAPGSAAERVEALLAAIQRQQSDLRQNDPDREPTPAERIQEGIEALMVATLADDQNQIDVTHAELYRLGVSRERAQERVLFLWAERNGYQLSSGNGKAVTRGRVFGKAKEGKGLRQQLPGFGLDRELHLLVSTAAAGKSTALAELAVVMSARDRGFLDHEAGRSDPADDPRQTVLVIASDGEGGAYNMWEAYLQDAQAEERGAIVEIWAQDDDTGERPWNVSLQNLDRLVRRLNEGDVCAVVIDTANSVLRGAGINAGIGPIETYLRLLKQIVCRHCALWMAHHTNRSGAPDLKGIGGHPAFQEVPSVVHLIEARQQSDGSKLRVWHVLKLRGSDYRRFAYELREGRLHVTEGHLFENCSQQVLVALHSQIIVKAGTTPGELIRVTKRPPQSVYNALNQLRGSKLIRRYGQGYRLTPSGLAMVEGLRV